MPVFISENTTRLIKYPRQNNGLLFRDAHARKNTAKNARKHCEMSTLIEQEALQDEETKQRTDCKEEIKARPKNTQRQRLDYAITD